ncbi:hypothetical protein Dda_5003 [Drechslerella dactyloides]|uniref:CAP-Gly domain-containing protein n=1 Tax=Drechslerella dactyloides TaxID=74499 RepID=A0AAD6IXY6_DREDA|nr:hypothetical protein Dda_5003 [Drechslerella dactyloides]
MATTPTTPTPTPRRSLARLRPSGAAAPNVPPVPPPMLSPETLLARKASFNQLTQNSSSKDSGYGGDSDGGLEIGDKVNVPGGMYGVVKFVGNVKGKPGVFVGVELEGPHAVNGKNDGTVEGTRYFTTSVPHSGIFLPLSRATPRHSGSSVKSGSDTPSVVTSPAEDSSPPQPPKKPFARPSLPRPQSPGGRNITPRPGLAPTTPGPRSGSSLSNRMFSPSPTPGGRSRGASVSSNATDIPGGGPGPSRLGNGSRPGQTPSRNTLRPGFNANKAHPPLPREPPRTGSALSYTNDASPTEDATPKANGMNGAANGAGFVAKLTRLSQENNMSKMEEDKGMIAILQAQLSAKDHQLKEQANNLLEMESSLNELQSLLTDGVAAQQQQQQQQQQTQAAPAAARRKASSISAHSGDGEEELELAQLRHLLRERNEKISQLQLDFDSHRADFRSTIDTLEMAATETERVYEKKVEDLLAELRELERQRQELLEDRIRREEEGTMPAGGVESVARQLKQLEALVAELEEGLEDARRGEAEARAEAEHCRGESERAKEELRREREKTTAFERRVDDLKESAKSMEGEVEKKNDEIRGLKAIMTSLSRGKPAAGAANGAKDKEKEEEEKAARKKLEERIKELEASLEKKTLREEELEKEVDQLKVSPLGLKITMPPKMRIEPPASEEPKVASSPSTKSDAPIASTTTSPITVPLRSSSLNMELAPRDSPVLTDIDDEEEPSINESTSASGTASTPPPPPPPKDDQLFCELCEKHGHDILACTEMFSAKPGAGKKDSVATFSTLEKAGMTPLPLNTAGVVGRSSLDHEDDGRNGGVSLARATTPNNLAGTISLPTATTPEPESANGLPATAGKSSGVVDRSKWCALCERDGHDSVDCPLDDF